MRYIFRPHLLTTLLMLIAFSGLLNLGFWQLNLGAQKSLTQYEYQNRHHQMISLDTLENAHYDLRFYKIILEGKFDNVNNLRVENKIYTPFIIFGSSKMILVDRGPLPQNKEIEPIFGQQKIKGILNKMPSSLSGKLHQPLHNYILLQNRFDASALNIQLEKHTLYATQIFISAGILFILFILIGIKRNPKIT